MIIPYLNNNLFPSTGPRSLMCCQNANTQHAVQDIGTAVVHALYSAAAADFSNNPFAPTDLFLAHIITINEYATLMCLIIIQSFKLMLFSCIIKILPAPFLHHELFNEKDQINISRRHPTEITWLRQADTSRLNRKKHYYLTHTSTRMLPTTSLG